MPHNQRRLGQRREKPTRKQRAAAILAPMHDASWRIWRRDRHRGARILQALLVLLYDFTDTPIPGTCEISGVKQSAEKTKDPAGNRDFQTGGVSAGDTAILTPRSLARNAPEFTRCILESI